VSIVGYNHQDTEDCLGIEKEGNQALIYIGQAYGETPIRLSVDELKVFIKNCQEVLTQIDEPKMYDTWEEAEAAMDRGETVRVRMQPDEINPSLLQVAQDFQDHEQLTRWLDKQ
jgi:hypothetical protein